ncbi:hypothetical protein BJV77DRAFT_991967 [Russula vinacea]|nr:hypothetical protein BJV77DRAFT_991967 [Russula vinacea]
MARLSPSSNISHHTADPRRQHDDNNNTTTMTTTTMFTTTMMAPVYESAAPTMSTRHSPRRRRGPGPAVPHVHLERGLPLLAPKTASAPSPRLDPPLAQHSHDVRRRRGRRRRRRDPSGSQPSSDRQQPQTPVPFSGGRKPTPRSVRIVSMQDSNAASGGGAGSGARREPTERTTATPRVSSTVAGASHYRLPSLPFLPSSLFRSRVWSRAKASALEGLSPTLLLSSSQTPDARLLPIPGLHLELLRDPSWKTRLHFYLFPLLVLAHLPLQSYLDFNAVYIMIEVAKFPNPEAPGVPGSGRNWVLGAVAYIACWFLWIFGVFLGYEVIYSFYRRWRFRRPLILPIYLSSPAFNFGSLRDALAETCYFYAQNLPTIVTLLPRAGLALALLLSFFSPENLPGGLTLSDVDQSIARRDGTFFDKSTGALSAYAKGVLIANAAWAAWRTLVLLLSWVGLWTFSGYGCAGLCGPRSRWEEEEVGRTVSIQSEKSESAVAVAMGASGADALPWSWKECSLLRVYEAYEFCLTLRAPRSEKSAERPPEGGFDGIEKVFAAVGLGGAAQPQPARRRMLSRDLTHRLRISRIPSTALIPFPRRPPCRMRVQVAMKRRRKRKRK